MADCDSSKNLLGKFRVAHTRREPLVQHLQDRLGLLTPDKMQLLCIELGLKYLCHSYLGAQEENIDMNYAGWCERTVGAYLAVSQDEKQS